MNSRSQAAALLAVLGACSTERAPDAPDAAAGGGALRLDCTDLAETILTTDATRQALAETYGAADSISALTEPNRHLPDATDSLFTVFYPGLTVSIRTPPSARDLVSGVDVTDNRYLVNEAVGIGAPAEQVIDVLGPPATLDDATLVYSCAEAVEQPVTFVLVNGAVARIEIEYYVD
ncbi:MAG: hypothetical protein WEF86_12610 [Gemmatimonadota bacterium]